MRCHPLVLIGTIFVAQIAFGQASAPEAPLGTHGREIKEPALAKELRTRVQSDQAVRQAAMDFFVSRKLVEGTLDLHQLDPKLAAEFKALSGQMAQEDERNRIWLKGVVEKHGWPGKTLVGGQGAKDAWLLVQHADQDRAFQQACLDKMAALPKGEVDPRDLAYLTDRVRVGAGKPQIYGTQVRVVDGKFVPNLIENESEVDQRRKAVGLEPLSEYLKAVEQAYTQPQQPEPAEKAGKP